ncbi:MAG: 50S ribosomal protein L13 [Patescibacteria group bacterium]
MSHHKQEIDAAGQTPGRLATQIAVFLMGKHKPTYVTHLDKGDKVVVLNVDKIVFTGKKLEQKVYRHHSMHPGGLKEVPARKMMEDTKEIIRLAVMKMLPKNKLRAGRINRLHFK